MKANLLVLVGATALSALVACNRAEESSFVDRFDEIFIGAEQSSHAGLIDNGHHDQGNASGARVAFQLYEHFPAILGFHDDIESDSAGLKLGGNFQSPLRLLAKSYVVSS